jgi:hypothetical protein
LPGYEELTRRLDAAGLEASRLSAIAMRRRARTVRVLADRLGRVIDRTDARVGFVVGYGTGPFALNLACAERDLESVELQHGFQGDAHWAYGRWLRVPGEGYELLPSIYWTWSDAEAAAINSWSHRVSVRHRAVAVGNPFMERWFDDDDPVVRRYDRSISDIAAPGGGVNVLVSLQTGHLDDQAVGEMLRDIGEAPSSWRWWVRAHPGMKGDELKRAHRLAAASRRVDVATVSAVPMYALLRQADVHVTGHSATVVEAAQFGVPSVATRPEAVDLFPRERESGWLALSRESPTVVDAIRAQLARRATLERPPRSPHTVDGELTRLVEHAERGTAARDGRDQP